jgi:dipeptidyl aminopeptidase/acylaminoacyl peptidase
MAAPLMPAGEALMSPRGSLLALILIAPCVAAAPRGFGPDDLVRLDRIDTPVLSPDQTRVVYSVRATDMDKNRGHTELWMVDLRTPDALPQQLTRSSANSTNPRWSPRGDALYFLSNRTGSTQVWRLALAGGEPMAVTDFPVDVGTFRIAPGGDRLAVTLAVFLDCPDLACTKERLAARAANPATGRLYDHLLERHWDAWSDGRRSVLYSVPLGPDGHIASAAVSLSGTLDGDVPDPPFGDEASYRFSPDGKTVAFSVKAVGRSEAWSTNFDIYEVAAAGGTPRNLTADNPAWDAEPAYSPDGRWLAYKAMTRPGFESDRFHLVVMDRASGAKRVVAGDWDRSVESLAWSADGRALYVTADDLGQRPLFRVDVASGKVTKLTGPGTVHAWDAGRAGAVYSLSTLSSPAQLFWLAGDQGPRQLTRANEARLSDIRFGEFEQFSFPGHGGDTVYGYVVKPWNWVPGGRYPIAFFVHGGPQSSFLNDWSYRWNPQVYAGAGYAFVFIDFHGSPGYGQAFTDSISRDWGGKPLEDLQKGLAAAVARYPWLDRSRACALGASYGGYMINWIAGNWPDGFRCLVNHDGTFDMRSMYYSTEELWFQEWENGGPYYDAVELHERFNPARFVDRWRTPMLVIHGELDYRIPVSQGLATFTALQRRGIESRLLEFPDENHWVLKPADSLQWHQTVLGWLEHYLKQ